MGANEIVKGLYVGDFSDALAIAQSHPDWFILCVLEQKPANEPLNSTWIPVLEPRPDNQMKANLKQLDVASAVIDSALQRGQTVLVHCGAGIERSPLTVAYYLVKKGIAHDFEEAYKILAEKRPQVQNRTIWF